MRGSYFLGGSNLEKCGKFRKKRPFFRADMARLGKYHTGGFGRIGISMASSMKFDEGNFRRQKTWDIAIS